MKRTLYLVLVLVLMSGCATVQNRPLTVEDSSLLKGQTLSPVSREKPDFAAMTAGKAVFALAGTFLMIREGNKIIVDNNIEDPATAISRSLQVALEKTHEVKIIPPETAVEGANTVQTSVAPARFVLDVQTTDWYFLYLPNNFFRYRVVYAAKAKLIDAHAKRVVAEGACQRASESSATAPTYDELLLNGAERLKAELALAADECTQKLGKDMLGV